MNITKKKGEVINYYNGIPIYSNGHEFSCDPNDSPNYTEKNIYCGEKWQCVEFVRRFLIYKRGLSFTNVNFASDIWNEAVFFDVITKKLFPDLRYPNGSKFQIKPLDLIIYDQKFRTTGHICIVDKVLENEIKVVEQNYDNELKRDNKLRSIGFDYSPENGVTTIKEPNVIGIIRVT